MGFVLLIFGIIALTSDYAMTKFISSIPGTSDIEQIVNLKELIKSSAIYLIILGIVIVGIGVFGCCGACCKIKWMLYLVSNRHVALSAVALAAHVSTHADMGVGSEGCWGCDTPTICVRGNINMYISRKVGYVSLHIIFLSIPTTAFVFQTVFRQSVIVRSVIFRPLPLLMCIKESKIA